MLTLKLLLRNIIRLSNGLGPDQVRHSVGPGLDPNGLQMFEQIAEVGSSGARAANAKR